MSRAAILAMNDLEVQEFILAFKLRPWGPTPARFDNSDALSSTAFVKSAMGSFNATYPFAGGTVVLGANHVGGRVEMAGAGSITIPKASSVPLGSTLLITTSLAAGVINLLTVAGDVLALNNFAVPTPYAMANSSDILIVADAGNTWRAHASTECLRTSPLFAASFGNSGFSKLPNGFIEMWGLTGGSAPGAVTPVTFAQAFPNNCFNIQMTYVDGGVQSPATRGSPWQVGNYTKTGFNYSHSGSSSASQHFWRAIGN